MLSRLARLRRSEEGFTLIELLVVVAIIALLATFAAPKLFDAINKAKKAPGQADLQTISSALERYYMDNNAYPASLSSLTSGYLKSTTTFLNGFKQGYLYGTTSTGSGYVLVDVQGVSTDEDAAVGQQIRVVCSGNNYDFTVSSTGATNRADINASHIDSCTSSTTGTQMVTH